MVESCYIKPNGELRVYNPEEFNYLFPDQWTRVKFGSYWRRRWKSNEILCQEDERKERNFDKKKESKGDELDGDLV